MGLQFAGMREWSNRPAFEAEVGARAPRTFKSCSRCQLPVLVSGDMAAVRWRTAVAHNDRQPGSSPGAATNHASLAQWESTALWPPHEMVRFHQLVPIPV